MARAFVRLEHDGPVSTLTIDRQDRLNALDAQVVGEIGGALLEVQRRADTRVLVVTGAGEKAFVAGADIAAMRSFDVDAARAFARDGHRVFAALEGLSVPAIAQVNGFALGGGCELALACDFIYASDRAKFGQPEVKLGVIPGFGGTQRLARRIGIARAREWVYSGSVFDAQEALRVGLVNRVLPAAELAAAVRALADGIATMGPLAVAAAKAVLRDGEGLPLPDANALEIDAFARCFDTHDQKEGMAAFLEKRRAAFRAE